MNEELLRRIPFFYDLPKQEIEILAHTMAVKILQAGEVLFHEGEPGDALFLVIEGELHVLRGEGTADEKVMARRASGEYVGEMSLVLPGGKRTASVRSAQDSKLWVLTRADFDSLLRRQPGVIFNLARILSERLDASNTATYREILAKNRELQQAYDELKAAQSQIIAKEKLEKELQLAAEIQISILPKQMPDLPGFDFAAFMDPARAIGGDFYDLFCIDEHRVGILIGDVADKGVPSALFMARVHALISAEAFHCDHPGEVLRRVNHYLFSREETDLFITGIYGMLDNRSGEFTYARAGHEIPLLHKAGQGSRPIPGGSGQPLGILDPILLDEQSVIIPPGGTLILFSDGMLDCRNPQGEPFGYKRLRETFDHCAAQSAAQTRDSLEHALLEFRSGAEQDDDVTLVTITRKRKQA
ncbi:MAG: SpoIIE family protein phosphatase [Anaerolineales bacterium]